MPQGQEPLSLQHQAHPTTWISAPQLDHSRSKEDPNEDYSPKSFSPTCWRTTSVPHCHRHLSQPVWKQLLSSQCPKAALTLIDMKCLERLVTAHIKSSIDITGEPHQYVYHRNRSTENAVSAVLHTALSHLENKNVYGPLIFINFTSAFNKVVAHTLVTKLKILGLNFSTCRWVLGFLINTPHSTITLSTGSPQGCVWAPSCSHYWHTTAQQNTSAVKFWNLQSTAAVGCIKKDDQSMYRQEVEHLEDWCRNSNLCINVNKTKEIILNSSTSSFVHWQSSCGCVIQLHLGVNFTKDLTWTNNHLTSSSP